MGLDVGTTFEKTYCAYVKLSLNTRVEKNSRGESREVI